MSVVHKQSSRLLSTVRQGKGGRHSDSGKSIAIFGATGFLARYVVNALGNAGWTVHVACRGDDMEWRHLKPLCDYGKLVPHYYSAKDEDSVDRAIPKGKVDVVLNLIGKRYETKHLLPWVINNTFEDTHVKAAAMVAKVARRNGVRHLVHVSCARASPDSSSRWSKTKAQGEVEAKREFPGACIVRPGQMYGEEDKFLNIIASLGKTIPGVFPLFSGGEAKLQPVFVGDVATAIASIVGDEEKFCGETVNLLGNDVYTVKQVIEYVHQTIGVRRTLIDVDKSASLVKMVAQGINAFPNPILTPDQVEQWCLNDQPGKPGQMDWSSVKVKPFAFENKAFTYLFRYREGGHFVELRQVEKTIGPAAVSHQVGHADVKGKVDTTRMW
jgi:NADH dehydrogenase (ubiquinone) 1 alpha subcomplex subunit 9